MINRSTTQLASRISELQAQGQPFVTATVVRAQSPTSAHPGDSAVVLADGSIEGFVGGQCAKTSVQTAALEALATGESTLLRVLPEGSADFPDTPGATNVVNPCHSGGALEIYLEPKLPAPVVAVVGGELIAKAMNDFAPSLGFAVEAVTPESVRVADDTIGRFDGCLAVIVASHGSEEPDAIRAALDGGVGYIGLVASAKRGKNVLKTMQLDPAEAAKIHTPVGVAIGAKTAEEIALSILAGIVRAVRIDGVRAPAAVRSHPISATDPVCGMTVTVVDDTPHLFHENVDYWFCNPGCRDGYAEKVSA